MRRAGIPWLTIAKVTGHKSVETLVKSYDLTLDVSILCCFVRVVLNFKTRRVGPVDNRPSTD